MDGRRGGLTETLITELSKVRSLKVISRTSVMQYKGRSKPLKQIGSELGVDAVVEGSALRVGDRVRITAQLISASTDAHLWGRDFDRDIHDVLDLQKEVAGSIARQVGATILPGKARPVNPEAMAAYLKGLYQFNRGELGQAVDLAREAVRLDPEMARAHELLALALLEAADFAQTRYETIVPEVRSSVRRALELDPDRHSPLSALGWSYFAHEHDWVQAEKYMRGGPRRIRTDHRR
jgi:TolB-like protein